MIIGLVLKFESGECFYISLFLCTFLKINMLYFDFCIEYLINIDMTNEF